MLGSSIEQQLCQVLATLGRAEKDLEIVRQTLCSMEDFTLQRAFQRLDRKGTKNIAEAEIIEFMKENKVYQISQKVASELVQFYDNDQNKKLDYDEFIQMLLPCEDNQLAIKVESRPAKMPLGKYEKLADIQECAITCIIDKELELLRKVNGLKQSMERSPEYSTLATFQMIDPHGSGNLTATDIQEFFQMNDESIPAPEVMGIIRRMDTSGDMTVSYEEWQLYFTPSWSVAAPESYLGQRGSKFSLQPAKPERSPYSVPKAKAQLFQKYSPNDAPRTAQLMSPPAAKQYLLTRDRSPLSQLGPDIRRIDSRLQKPSFDGGSRSKAAGSPLRTKVNQPGNGTKTFSASYSDVNVRKYRPSADHGNSIPERPKRSQPVNGAGTAETPTRLEEQPRMDRAGVAARSRYDRTRMPLAGPGPQLEQERMPHGSRLNGRRPQATLEDVEVGYPPQQYEEPENIQMQHPDIDARDQPREPTVGAGSQLARSQVPSQLIETRSVNDLDNTRSQHFGATADDTGVHLVDRQIQQVSLRREKELERTVDFERDPAATDASLGQTMQTKVSRAIARDPQPAQNPSTQQQKLGVTFPTRVESPIRSKRDGEATPSQKSFPGSKRPSAFDNTSMFSGAAFRNMVDAEANAEHPAERDRYHLYINLGCPWSMSAYTALLLKGLQDCIPVSCTRPEEEIDEHGSRGFVFDGSLEIRLRSGTQIPSRDTVNHCSSVAELYHKAAPSYQGPYTLPILWDTKAQTIVSNDSLDIVKMFNNSFNAFAKQKQLDMIPEDRRAAIEGAAAGWLLNDIGQGVYKIGYAETQEQYEHHFAKLYVALDKAEGMLESRKYLFGDKFTIADLRLFQTLIRYDAAYLVLFRCNKRAIRSYKNIQRYLRHLYHDRNLKQTVDIDHIKRRYFLSHPELNPRRLIPAGPEPWWEAPPRGEHESVIRSKPVPQSK